MKFQCTGKWLVVAVLVAGAARAVSAPVISEFLARNSTGITDGDGERSDWIEIYNPGTSPIDLGGWHLTDDLSELDKWVFPPGELAPGQHQLVFASGKDKVAREDELHTSFSLDGDGEFLALVKPDGITVISQYGPSFPAQRSDVSFGMEKQKAVQLLVGQGSDLVFLLPSRSLSAAWRHVGFDDSDWEKGALGLGFDDSSEYNDFINTSIRGAMFGKNASALVRMPFEMESLAEIDSVLLKVLADDGFVAWINGVRVASHNAPPVIKWNSTAETTDPELQSFRFSSSFSSLPDETGLHGSAKVSNGHLKLTLNRNNQSGSFIVNDFTGGMTVGGFEAVFHARVGGGTDNPADGFSFSFANDLPDDVFPQGEEGAGSGLIVSFDTWDNGAGEAPAIEVFANGASVGRAKFTGRTANNDPSPITNPATGQPASLETGSAFVQVQIAFDNGLLDVSYGGITVFEGLEIELDPIDGGRFALAARTGGANANHWIDNLKITATSNGRRAPISPIKVRLADIKSILRDGRNVLAIHGLNSSPDNGDFLVAAELLAERTGLFKQIAGFYQEPSPGKGNPSGALAINESPRFSHPGGAFTGTLFLTLSAENPDAVIRYTTNGRTPTARSTIYNKAIRLTGSKTLMAQLFLDGYRPGPVAVRNYAQLGNDLGDFDSNLPLFLVDTQRKSIPNGMFATAYFSVLDGGENRTSIKDPPRFQSKLGIKIRGSSSTGFAKKSYAMELRDETGADMAASLIGFPSESDWVLYGPYSDKTLMRNSLTFELSNQMGQYAPRTRFVEVFINSNNTQFTLSDYQGVYVLMEKIKRDRNRLDIEKLERGDNTEPRVTGGYILKKDRLDPGDSGFTTSRGYRLGYVEPKEREVSSKQQAYLRKFFRDFERALYGRDYRDPIKGYAPFIDTLSFVDCHLLVEFSKNIDGYRLSHYMYKDRDGPLTLGPAWDYNLSFGNANYLQGWQFSGWYYPQVGASDYPWFARLFQDVEFKQLYADRWAELRRNVLSQENVLGLIDRYALLLEEGQQRNYTKWKTLGKYLWPNWFIGKTYKEEIDWMKTWTAERLAWMDKSFIKSPELVSQQGDIEGEYEVEFFVPAGTIYYTMDGTDPRAFGGTVAGTASVYRRAVVISKNSQVIARAKRGTRWSAPVIGTFIVRKTPLIISEIMYHPKLAGEGSPFSTADFEYLEIRNIGDEQVDLSGVRLIRGVKFDFPLEAAPVLKPGQNLLLVRNRLAFESRYGAGLPVVGEFQGALNNGGERLRMEGRFGEGILDFAYNDAWQPATDGHGFALVAQAGQAEAMIWGKGESWVQGTVLDGTPGLAEPPSKLPEVWINEILAHTDPPNVDFIELHNPGPKSAAVGGWFLTDDRRQPGKYRIPNNTIIPAHGFLVFTEAHFNNPASESAFSLSSTGEEVWLFSANSEGALTGFADGFQFGASATGKSLSRHINSAGIVNHPTAQALTPGRANTGPQIGPVIISELHYNPLDKELEFVELVNLSNLTLPLFDPDYPEHLWELGGLGYVFPRETSIPRHGILVIAKNPGQLAARFSIPGEAVVIGPFEGRLKNEGEWLRLLRPDSPNVLPNGSVEVPMVIVDEVRYNNRAPWPKEADGTGFSLEKTISHLHGNDPVHWRASPFEPSPGMPNGSNRMPHVEAGGDIELTAGRFPVEVPLKGATQDDGIPRFPGRLTLEWFVRQGAGTPWFSDPGQASTTLYLTGPGVFHVELSASDGDKTARDTMIVTINRESAEKTLIARGATWKYLDDGSNQGTRWRAPDFDDGSWKSGRAELGYGDADVKTEISYGGNASQKNITTWFRHPFTVADPGSIRSLTLGVVRDDGAVVYLNGSEVFRSNMPEGRISYNTTANSAIGGADESAFYDADIDPAKLRAGKNVFAVEIHQANGTSSDLSFNLELNGMAMPENKAPTVVAGDDFEAPLFEPVLLRAEIRDDGLPTQPGAFTLRWDQLAGPVSSVLQNPGLPWTYASFSVPGLYHFRISATDGVESANDTIRITIVGSDWTAWLAQHFSPAELADSNWSGEHSDPDLDGQTNRNEYFSGTDPIDAASCLRLAIAESEEDRVVLFLKPIPGRSYTIQHTHALGLDDWSNLVDLPAGDTEDPVEVEDLLLRATQKYYRIVTPRRR